MKTSADFNQCQDPSRNRDLTGGRHGNVGKQLKYGRLTRTIVPNNSHRLASFDLKTHIAHRPDFLRALSPTSQPAHQRKMARSFDFLADQIFLGDTVKYDIRHV